MKRAIITVDLGFGDSGKGSFVDALVRLYGCRMVVRYSGGAQAAHNVITPEGLHHTFAQLGAGSFVPECHTFLGSQVVVNPLTMVREWDHFEHTTGMRVQGRVHVDGRCLITTPYHRALNRLLELSRGAKRHGSCGMGVGETVRLSRRYQNVLRVRDLSSISLTLEKLLGIQRILHAEAKIAYALVVGDARVLSEAQREFSTFDVEAKTITKAYHDWSHQVAIHDPVSVSNLLAAHDTLVFEGAHGLLIDEDVGFYPHVTWNSVTPQHAYALLDEAEWRGSTTVLGLLRTYSTRHGPGPFPSETKDLSVQEVHNRTNPWQQHMRLGHLDLPLLRYAITGARNVDGLAVSCLDQVPKKRWRYVREYTSDALKQLTAVPADDLDRRTELANLVAMDEPRLGTVRLPAKASDVAILEVLENALARPVLATSFGPTAGDKVFDL